MSDQFVGEIRMFGGNYAPENWALCDGRVLSISQYSTLYSLIGTTYGGDGQTTFALPDLRSRIPIHMGSSYAIGVKAGAENVTLTAQQIPAHTHAAQANSAGATTGPAGNVWANSTANQFTTTATNTTMNPAAVPSVGGGQSHDNMVPFQVVNFIIALEGYYPPRP